MNRFYKDHNFGRKTKLWKSKSSYRRGKGNGNRGKIVIALGAIVAVFALFQFNVFSVGGLKTNLENASASVKNVYHQAVSWSSAKLGLEEAELLLPVSSGVVVEDYGVVNNDKGEANYHTGVDIKVPADSEVLAAEAGEVTAVDTREDGTFWITLKHDKSWSTVYGRLGKVNVAQGDTVEKGAVLGIPQNETLHFEVLEKGTQKNPINYFQSN